MDLQICLKFGNKNYDLSNIEFKKDGDSSQSLLEDAGKVLVEGKTILNNLSKMYNCNLDEAKELEVIVGQFYGVKGIFRSIELIAPGAYRGGTWGKTLRYPISEWMISAFATGTLSQLFAFKDKVVKDAFTLNQALMEDDSSFGWKEEDYMWSIRFYSAFFLSPLTSISSNSVLPITNYERSLFLRWRFGWLPGGKPKNRILHPGQHWSRRHFLEDQAFLTF